MLLLLSLEAEESVEVEQDESVEEQHESVVEHNKPMVEHDKSMTAFSHNVRSVDFGSFFLFPIRKREFAEDTEFVREGMVILSDFPEEGMIVFAVFSFAVFS